MKKLGFVMTLILVLGMLAGCSKSSKTENTVTELVPIEVIRNVLLYEEKFVYTGAIYNPDDTTLKKNSVVDLNEYIKSFSDKVSGTNHKIDSFSVIDLDGDGIKEVVLYINPGYAEILHYANGKVYLSGTSYRGLAALRTDGTFEGSSGASNTNVMKAQFVNNALHTVDIAIFDSDKHVYRIGDKNVTMEEWIAWDKDRSDKVPLCEEHDFTGDNINEYVK